MCDVFGGDWGSINYVYQDPLTKKLKESRARIENNISHLVIGEKTGDIKMNAKTGEYFPALFLYDPYTGEKLEWGVRK
jgi:hypothetical protein